MLLNNNAEETAAVKVTDKNTNPRYHQKLHVHGPEEEEIHTKEFSK